MKIQDRLLGISFRLKSDHLCLFVTDSLTHNSIFDENANFDVGDIYDIVFLSLSPHGGLIL